MTGQKSPEQEATLLNEAAFIFLSVVHPRVYIFRSRRKSQKIQHGNLSLFFFFFQVNAIQVALLTINYDVLAYLHISEFYEISFGTLAFAQKSKRTTKKCSPASAGWSVATEAGRGN